MQVGVEVDDIQGDSYSYERGNTEFTAYSRQEVHLEDKDGAAESFDNTVAKRHAEAADRILKDKEVDDRVYADEDDEGEDDNTSHSGSTLHGRRRLPAEVVEISDTQVDPFQWSPTRGRSILRLPGSGNRSAAGGHSACGSEDGGRAASLPSRSRPASVVGGKNRTRSLASVSARGASPPPVAPTEHGGSDTEQQEMDQDGQGNGLDGAAAGNRSGSGAPKAKRQDERDLKDAEKALKKRVGTSVLTNILITAARPRLAPQA